MARRRGRWLRGGHPLRLARDAVGERRVARRRANDGNAAASPAARARPSSASSRAGPSAEMAQNGLLNSLALHHRHVAGPFEHPRRWPRRHVACVRGRDDPVLGPHDNAGTHRCAPIRGRAARPAAAELGRTERPPRSRQSSRLHFEQVVEQLTAHERGVGERAARPPASARRRDAAAMNPDEAGVDPAPNCRADERQRRHPRRLIERCAAIAPPERPTRCARSTWSRSRKCTTNAARSASAVPTAVASTAQPGRSSAITGGPGDRVEVEQPVVEVATKP